MPDYMHKFGKSLQMKDLPSAIHLPKRVYVKKWIELFEADFANDVLNSQPVVDEFSQFSVVHLRTAFEWTLAHYAELDFGGNMRWLGSIKYILKQLKNKKWTSEAESALLADSITETRWYEA
jgi:hypothetical protein